MTILGEWKRLENRVAEYFGGIRRRMHPRRSQGPDVGHPIIDLEVKVREKLPTWVEKYIKKMVAWNRSGKLSAIVIYSRKNQNPAEGYAIMRTCDFKVLMEGFYQQSLFEQSSPSETPLNSITTEQPASV